MSLLREHEGAPILEVVFGREPVALPGDRYQHADGDIRAWWRGDDVLFLAHGGCSARVDADTAVIGGEGDLRRGFRQLLPYVITHLLARRDRFVLHGGAITRCGSTALVLGGSGAGKSTLVASALHAGWNALGDDLVALRLGEAGPEVIGIAKPLAVPADVVRFVSLLARPMDGDPRGRWQVPLSEPTSEWYPVTTTIVSGHAGEARAELRPLTSHRLVEWLLFSFLSAREPTRLRRYLPTAAAVASRRGWELRHGRDPEARVAEVGSLLRDLPAMAGTI